VLEDQMDLLIGVGALVFATLLVWKTLGRGKLRSYLRRTR
jgi:hypothetical protein